MEAIFSEDLIIPYLNTYESIITEVSKEFTDFTGYTSDEILMKNLFDIGDILKLNTQTLLDNIDNSYTGFIFTKSLEVREVEISTVFSNQKNEKIYTFKEIIGSGLDKKFLFVEQLYQDNTIGVAIHSVPDLLLLKANQVYINFQDSPYNNIKNSLGKPFKERVLGFEGSKAEDLFKNIIKTGASSYQKEFEYEYFLRGITYWDSSLIPIFEEGKVKYIIETVSEVTERVVERKLIEEQKELLETIIENMSEAFIIYNKEGSCFLKNSKACMLYPETFDSKSIENPDNKCEYFDLNGNRILPENLPECRALKGEKIRNDRILIKHPRGIKYTEINATPIFDNENNLISAVVSHHDISESIKNQQKIKKQQELLLIAEKEKNEALEKALVLKDEFFVNISHELKTPLNVIYSTVQLFNIYCRDGSLDEKKDSIIKYIDSIKKNSYRLSKLINNIVDLSKIEAGFLELYLSNNNIVELVEEIVMSVTDYTASKGLNIIFDTDVEENIIACDPEKIERIILNLISNAIKFSNTGDEILVSIKDKNEFIEISVKDNGIGIEEMYLDMIFDRYKQVDKSLSRNAEGTGIGLSLVKSIVELHGGSIFVESEYGNGSKFTVVLPTRKVMQENMLLSNKMRNRNESIQVEFSDICS